MWEAEVAVAKVAAAVEVMAAAIVVGIAAAVVEKVAVAGSFVVTVVTVAAEKFDRRCSKLVAAAAVDVGVKFAVLVAAGKDYSPVIRGE